MSYPALPDSLPAPLQDHACDHLDDTSIPSISLPSTSGSSINLSTLSGLTVLFIYPRSGAPGESIPPSWDAIPGARGCTPQACSYRDNLPRLRELGVERVFGMSTQTSDYQRELKERVGLGYDLLSDERLEMQKTLRLPVFEWEGKVLIKRITLAIRNGKVQKVWYPVFPPDRNVQDVLEWLQSKE